MILKYSDCAVEYNPSKIKCILPNANTSICEVKYYIFYSAIWESITNLITNLHSNFFCNIIVGIKKFA